LFGALAWFISRDLLLTALVFCGAFIVVVIALCGVATGKA